MQLFYTPDINTNEYTLSKEESKHCIQVLRKKTSDTIYLVDGKGGFYTASILNENPKSCQLLIKDKVKEYGKSHIYIHIAIAPTKMNDRLEWFLEKATELGINEITPIICEHSERKVIKHERLNKILIAAMKQSQRAYLPKLNQAIPFKSFIQKSFDSDCFIAYCSEEKKVLLKNAISKGKDTLILIGPEGDFSKSEINLSKKKKFIAVSLGDNRLRTETAGLVSCHTINLINQ